MFLDVNFDVIAGFANLLITTLLCSHCVLLTCGRHASRFDGLQVKHMRVSNCVHVHFLASPPCRKCVPASIYQGDVQLMSRGLNQGILFSTLTSNIFRAAEFHVLQVFTSF